MTKNFFRTCLALILGPSLIVTSSVYSSAAFGGYAHYETSSRAIKSLDEYERKLSEEEERFYLGGAVAADIGRFKWDGRYIDSDSVEFKDKMVEIASRSESRTDKAFALGWSDHVVQDCNCGSLLDSIFKCLKNYRLRCGLLDAYIYDNKVGYLYLNRFSISYDLIKNSYRESTGFSPDDEDIVWELKKILYAFYFQSWLGFWGLTAERATVVEEELDKLSRRCGVNNRDYEKIFQAV